MRLLFIIFITSLGELAQLCMAEGIKCVSVHLTKDKAVTMASGLGFQIHDIHDDEGEDRPENVDDQASNEKAKADNTRGNGGVTGTDAGGRDKESHRTLSDEQEVQGEKGVREGSMEEGRKQSEVRNENGRRKKGVRSGMGNIITRRSLRHRATDIIMGEDTQALLNELSEAQKVSVKRLGVNTRSSRSK